MKEGINMKCPHCGEELPEEYEYIPKEKNSFDSNENTPVDSNQNTAENNESPGANSTGSSIEHSLPVFIPELESNKGANLLNKRIAQIIACLLLFAVVICGIFIGFIHNSKADLREKLSGSWEVSNSSFPTSSLLAGASITFDKDSITYSESLGMFETNTATASYKIISSDVIEINGNRYEIVFKGTNSMTITPGLTGNQSETWIKEQSYADEQYDDNQSKGIV